jgi:predicted TPR repeat methyltransferase
VESHSKAGPAQAADDPELEEAKRELRAMAPQYLAWAIDLHAQGKSEQAESVYLGVLAVDPENVDALHYLGIMRHQQGRSLLAIDLVSRAIELRPDYVDACNNLGNIYEQLGVHEKAAEAYRNTLALRPEHPEALRNLGIVLRQLKRYEESVEAHQRALEREPDSVQILYALAATYREMGRIDQALGTLRQALAGKPEPDGYRRLGQMLYGLRRIDEAAAVYEEWLRLDSENPVARHMLAACTLKDVPTRAGDAFVTDVFDGFAETFDRVLCRLEYRAPALVGEALSRTQSEARGELDIVDAGCGTGLLAQHLRAYARRLVGVDLSPKMLERASKRAVYDELVVAELVSFLRSSPETFDIVASSDTLVYFGDLRDALAAARMSLRPGGRLFFTLEEALNQGGVPEGYRIHAHGRYSHTQLYVRRTLAEAGFELIAMEKAHLRREGSSNVDGLVIAARRP